jgi:hypothetical protein
MKNLTLVIGVNLVVALTQTTLVFNGELNLFNDLIFTNLLFCGVQAFINLICGIYLVQTKRKKASAPFFISVGLVCLIGFSACSLNFSLH